MVFQKRTLKVYSNLKTVHVYVSTSTKAGFPLRDFFRAKRYSIAKFE